LICSPGSATFRGRLSKCGWRDDRAAQLVEFAVALPLLVLFVVGIFDFSNAFTFKQKLTNIARDAARVAAADPASDLRSPSTNAPASVIDAFQIVDNYLVANKINDCNIQPSSSPTGLTWTSTANGNGCPNPGVTLVINRGYYFSAAAAAQPTLNCSAPQLAGPQTLVIATCVSIQYPYQWRFRGIASILGANTSLPTTITAAAVAMNEN
jgi:Flp pilus assembly protein TadG